MTINVDKKFNDFIVSMQEAQALRATARRSSGPLPWMQPTGAKTSPALAIHDSFDTAEVEEELSQELQSTPKTLTDTALAAALFQIDYMSRAERAFHQRHAINQPRLRAHSVARSEDHADGRGALGAALRYATYLVGLGGTK